MFADTIVIHRLASSIAHFFLACQHPLRYYVSESLFWRTVVPIHSLHEDSYSAHLLGLNPFVRQCGNDRRGRWSLRDRKLLDYLLVYIKEGSGVFSLEGHQWVVREGDLFWIPPDTLSSMESRSPTMVCPFIHFDLVHRNPESHWDCVIPEHTCDLASYGDRLHPPMPADSIFHRVRGLIRLRPAMASYACRLIEEICTDSALMRPFHLAEQSAKMVLLLSLILRELMVSDLMDDALWARLQRIPEYLMRNLAEATVAGCASECALSESYFRKLFTEVYGMPPQTYLVRMRMRYATELMSDPRLSLTCIAQACGYASQHNFSRIFTKTMGVTPSGYRRGVLA